MVSTLPPVLTFGQETVAYGNCSTSFSLPKLENLNLQIAHFGSVQSGLLSFEAPSVEEGHQRAGRRGDNSRLERYNAPERQRHKSGIEQIPPD